MAKIILTGGGTAGHATPNLALKPLLEQEGNELIYIGTKTGIEKSLVEATGMPYYAISSGKLRRYFSTKNISDLLRIAKGYFEAKHIIKKEKPDLVFSKGGFVTVPVVFAAHAKKVPVVIHESDYTPGLANKLSIPKADKVCVTFSATATTLPEHKRVVTGLPVRGELLTGNRQSGLDFLGFSGSKPILLIIGGSLGAQAVNEAIDSAIEDLLKRFDIVHSRGAGKLNPDLNALAGYRQFEYLSEELKDIYACADVVISRAGANVIFELLALKKLNLLIPLPKESSRGDQILNANYFEKMGYSLVLEQKDITNASLLGKLDTLLDHSETFIQAMDQSEMKSGTDNTVRVIQSMIKA